MIQDNMDFLDNECYGSDFDIDRENYEPIETISIPAWRTASGTLLAIQHMDTSHIKNCIKKIYRSNGTWRSQYLPFLREELLKRKYAEEVQSL